MLYILYYCTFIVTFHEVQTQRTLHVLSNDPVAILSLYVHTYIYAVYTYSMAQSGSTNERGSPIGVVEGDGVDDILVSL